MSRVTSVLAMARGKGNGKVDEGAKRKALAEVKETSDAVREHDEGGEGLRQARNRAIVNAAKHAPATEIAQAAGIKQSYVSRVIRSRGRPASGSDLDRSRDAEETADA